MIDFEKINAHALASYESLLASWLPGGRKEGANYAACCPFHSEKTPSFKAHIHKGNWHCFGCGKSGSDPVSLYAELNSLGQADGAKKLADYLAIHADTPAPEPQKKRRSEWEPIVPVPEGTPMPGQATLRDYHYGAPENVWQYHTAEGELVGFIRRFKKTTPREDGTFGKEIKPLVWAQNSESGEFAWRSLSFPKPRPLYRLRELVSSTGRVTLVEGEKCADALASLGPTVTTWAGGAQAIKHVDWTPLTGRKVTIWPDADAPGISTAQGIAKTLHGLGCEVRIITPPADVPEGWDVADAIAEGWDAAQIGELAQAAVTYAPETPPAPPAPTPPADTPPPPPPPAEPRDTPFRILGHDQGDFFYLSHASRQIVSLSASGHRKENLLQLAPLNWWEESYPGSGEGGGVNWLMAANSLMQHAMRQIFDPADVRGRGAWLDHGDVIYHAGDQLHINGRACGIAKYDSDFVYQRGRKIALDETKPADTRDAARLLHLCACLNLRNRIDYRLLAGWIVCAPICGALDWRPHIWITGPSGSGKTWLIERIIRPLLGNMAIYVQSSTSEAGIRQTLGCDALPVMFDEAETENQRDAARLQQVLILARQASRDSGGKIVKGTSGGSAMAFHVRSSFCFSSIGVAATQRADLSRITPLELFKRNGEDARNQWADLCACWEHTAALPEWCASIRARSIMLAKVIAKNALTFATACTRYLGAQRDGDQIGALLAGAWALDHDGEISPEECADWCAKQDWSMFESQDVDMDEHRCFQHLMGAIIQHEEHGHMSRRSVGELIHQATDFTETNKAAARDTLGRYGIGIRREGVDISNSHQELRRIFADTPFSGKWADQLKRLTGAESKQGHFNKVLQRCVRLPLAMFEGEQKSLDGM